MGLRPDLRRRLRDSQLGLRPLVSPLVRRHLHVQVADDRHIRLLVRRHRIVARTQSPQLLQQRGHLAPQALHHVLLLQRLALHVLQLPLPLRLSLDVLAPRRVHEIQVIVLRTQRVQIRTVLQQLGLLVIHHNTVPVALRTQLRLLVTQHQEVPVVLGPQLGRRPLVLRHVLL